MFKKILYLLWHNLPFQPYQLIAKSYSQYKENGLKELKKYLNREYYALYSQQINLDSINSNYDKWIKSNERNIYKIEKLSYSPLISIVVPTCNTEIKYLIEMIESVLKQTYKNFELCIADDASSNQETIKTLKRYASRYNNIKVIFREKNGHISEATNSALSITSGEYIAFLDHDDTLAPNALYEMVKKLNEDRNLKLLYSDEDKIDEKSKRFMPHFKSGWNPDMFFSQNYLCHFVMMKKDIVEKIGGLRVGYEGSQDYDLLLRSLKHIKASEIAHIEKILYHWRAIKGSTAYDSEERNYTHEAELKALEDFFKTNNTQITIESGLLPNTYKVNHPIPSKEPLVSLLIPTRDGYDILSQCIESIREKTLYKNYEILILDNETTCKKTLAYFEKIKQYSNIKVLEYHHPFNYSAINNFGVKHTKGEIIGLINNDVEIISEGWLSEMVSHAIRPEIGAVGAMLYYSNDTIQHAGVVLGLGGVAGHSHKYFKKGSHGYFSRLKIVQNYSAVTGACLLVDKKLYEEVGGLDETNLKVAFNDVDFCLKLLQKGYRNLWTPYAELYHHESISRGAEDTPQKKERFAQEVNYMKKKWGIYIKEDKCYNSNLTRRYENFSLN